MTISNKEKDDLIKRAISLPDATEQVCQICNQSYTGIRIKLCEQEECRKWFTAERQSNAYKYGPVDSMPNGALFYIDLNENETEVPKVKTKDEFIAKMVEFGKKLIQPKKKCDHNWVMDGHNAGDPICSKCYSRE